MLVSQGPRFSSISSTWEPCSALFQPFFSHQRVPIRIILVFGEQTDIPSSVLSTIQVPVELPQTVFLTRCLQVGDRPDSFREEPPDLLMFDHDWATCVVKSVSIFLDIRTGILSNFGPSFIFTWVYADTASAACPSQSRSLAITSITFPAVFGDPDEPCSMKTAWAPESTFSMSHRSRTRPLYFWYFWF